VRDMNKYLDYLKFLVYEQSIMKYWLILGCNLPNSKKIFTLENKIIRSVVGAESGNSCRGLIKRLTDFTTSM
jgi:hypothetical protein